MNDLRPDHDLHHLATALGFVRQWRVAIDGGAHVGIWSRVLAQRFARVIAFEPCGGNAARFDVPGVELYRCALGAAGGEVSMAPGPENTGQWHVVPGPGVQVLTVDALCLEALDFLKLDVEGYELFALQGAVETLRACRPVVLIEENGLCRRYGVSPGAAGEFLRSLGARRVAVCNKDEVYTWEAD